MSSHPFHSYNSCLCFSNIFHKPLTYFLGTILCTALNLNLGSTHIGVKRSVYRLTNEFTLLFKIKVLKEHSH